MSFRRSTFLPRFLAALLAALLLAAPAARACRIIIYPIDPIDVVPPPPRDVWIMPPRAPELAPMQVKSHKVSIDVRDQVARVTVRAVFYNPNSRRIEGTYYFPVAPDAAVNSFSMTVNGKTMEAQLLPADKARAIYEEIVRREQDPAILEYIDQGMLRARVFPIEPMADVAIELSYDQKIVVDGNLARVRYPLLSARPDGNGTIQSLVVEATIKSKTPLKAVFVPGYNVSVTRPDDNTARIGFEAGNISPERDFELVFSRQPGTVGVDFLSYKKDSNGYFMMLISPRSELQAEEIAAKDLTFVIDTSGSMSGEKLKQAKAALTFCVNSLTEKDHFTIISFSTDVTPLWISTQPANEENRTKALAFIDFMQARGGTAIDDAIRATINTQHAPGKTALVVFLTDGLPTVGQVDPDTILGQLKTDALPRIFTFGVGNDVNTKLLNGIANKTHGFPTYVAPGEDLEVALSSFYTRIASPVMTDLKIDTGDAVLQQMNPPMLPDLFRGGMIAVTGRFIGDGTHKMVLSGQVGNARESFAFTADYASDALNSYIPRLWAVQRVAFLEEQILLHGRNKELVDEIMSLGREYGIVTRYTSLLIVEDGLQASVRQRVQEDARSGGDGVFNNSAAPATTGSTAVREARELQARKGGGAKSDASAAADGAPMPSVAEQSLMEVVEIYTRETPGSAGSAVNTADAVSIGRGDRAGNGSGGRAVSTAETLANYVKTVDDKTFYRRAADDYLYDSLIPRGDTPRPDIVVKAWSPEFFALLKTHPQLRHYLQAGTRLVLRLDNKTIKVTDE